MDIKTGAIRRTELATPTRRFTTKFVFSAARPIIRCCFSEENTSTAIW